MTQVKPSQGSDKPSSVQFIKISQDPNQSTQGVPSGSFFVLHPENKFILKMHLSQA
jgi:hypothetical protein